MPIETIRNCDGHHTCFTCPHNLCPKNEFNVFGAEFAVVFEGWRNKTYMALFDAFEENRYFFLSSNSGLKEIPLNLYKKLITIVCPSTANEQIQRVTQNNAYELLQRKAVTTK